jgi:hypothetical protein
MIAKKQIDEKHHIEASVGDMIKADIKIIKTSNGQAIPDDEPIILFRGRDKLALPMLLYYKGLCQEDGCTQYQLVSMDKMIKAFDQFYIQHYNKMKQPGITLGK